MTKKHYGCLDCVYSSAIYCKDCTDNGTSKCTEACAKIGTCQLCSNYSNYTDNDSSMNEITEMKRKLNNLILETVDIVGEEVNF